jgi:hypothetical protein
MVKMIIVIMIIMVVVERLNVEDAMVTMRLKAVSMIQLMLLNGQIIGLLRRNLVRLLSASHERIYRWLCIGPIFRLLLLI